MDRLNPRVRNRSRMYRQRLAPFIGLLVPLAFGCVPAEEGTATDAATAAAGQAISGFLIFITDFARQLLAAYLF